MIHFSLKHMKFIEDQIADIDEDIAGRRRGIKGRPFSEQGLGACLKVYTVGCCCYGFESSLQPFPRAHCQAIRQEGFGERTKPIASLLK